MFDELMIVMPLFLLACGFVKRRERGSPKRASVQELSGNQLPVIGLVWVLPRA